MQALIVDFRIKPGQVEAFDAAITPDRVESKTVRKYLRTAP